MLAGGGGRRGCGRGWSGGGGGRAGGCSVVVTAGVERLFILFSMASRLLAASCSCCAARSRQSFCQWPGVSQKLQIPDLRLHLAFVF